MPATDAELIRLARTDPEALGELFQRHAPSLERWLSSQLPFAVAAEITAETFAQAALSLGGFRDEADGSAAPWLFGIARNLLRRYLERDRLEDKARKRLDIRLAGLDELEAIDERIASEALGEQLEESMAALAPDQRRAVELRVIEQMDYRQIAASLGCSEVAARLRVMRGLATLRRGLTSHESGTPE